MPDNHFDVLIIGAGLSGIGAAYRLQTMCPGKTYAILEGRSAIGGTWDLFRYPGVRSDSDMFTLGYPFKPWTAAKAIADGPSILDYIRETADENDITRHIRFGHRVIAASWSSSDACWTVEATTDDGSESLAFTCSYLYLCSGYYRHDHGYTPDFPGVDSFRGQVIHPQKWPDDVDYAGKSVLVVGSGATAVTLVPAMAETAGHVTMLQRSPTYITSVPAEDPIADFLRRVLPERIAHRLARWKNVLIGVLTFQIARRRPDLAKRLLREGVQKQLPAGYDPSPDFEPRYNPWDQRLCLVPDGDLFASIRNGSASIVTDEIDSFTPTGVRLLSGTELAADVVITATGLTLVACGGIHLEIDGVDVDPGHTVTYRGFMLSGVPNLAICVGYTNASWTLRADLASQAVCRLINHMTRKGYASATPVLGNSGGSSTPILSLTSGYVLRSVDLLPKQGTGSPWMLRQNYILDFLTTRFGRIDASMFFASAPRRPTPTEVQPQRTVTVR